MIPLAWFAMRIRPETRATFQWENEYQFVWSKIGILMPGVIFDAEQTISSNPPHQNTITFGYNNSHYEFSQATNGRYSNLLTVITQEVVVGDPANSPSIGIANSGSPLFARQAQPYTTNNFLTPPQLRYRIARGNYVQGQVLDTRAVTDFVEIIFLRNQFEITVTLNTDMTWSIQPA